MTKSMYKAAIESMNTIQESRLTSISLRNNRLILSDGPQTKQSGLYWIYTRHTDEELLGAYPSSKRASINFHDMVRRHSELSNVCMRKVGQFRLVYNGIGGVGPRGAGGLRERILEEFRGGEGTGSLAIKDSSLNDLGSWRFSYVLWSEINTPTQHTYAEFAEAIERLWRIHYGWPILCTK